MGGSGKSYNTVAISFTMSLAGLLEELRRTDSGFVRCIKPNAPLTPNYFHATMALHQLRTCGMVQAVKMMMAMYGARFPYVDIVSSWTQGKSYLPAPLASLPPKELVMKLCRVLMCRFMSTPSARQSSSSVRARRSVSPPSAARH